MEALKWQTSHSKDYAKNFTVGQMIEQYINSKTNVLSPSTINGDKTKPVLEVYVEIVE